MSRGPGRIQKVITDLIASDPHGAWTVGQICQHAYPDEPCVPEKTHRVAVTRALRKMVLPSTWSVRMLNRRGSEYYIYDRCDLKSAVQVYRFENRCEPKQHWLEDVIKKSVADACRYRDASPLEKIDIEREWLKRRMEFAKATGGNAAALADEAADLEKRRQALTGQPD